MPGLDVTAIINKNSFTGPSSTTLTTDANGEAVFDNLTLDQAAADYEITFTLNPADSIPDTTTAKFNVVNEVAVISIQNQPQLTIAGEYINGPPSVKLETPGGTPISGGTIYASLNQSDFTAESVVSATTNSSGIATFDSLVIDDANTGYEITFSSNSSGIAPSTSASFEIVAPLGSIEVSQQPLETVNGEAIAGPPTITITETNGDPWGGNEVDITVSVNKNGFSSGTLTKTTTGGSATFDNLILNSIDNDYQLTFSTDISERIPAETTDSFDVVAVTGQMNVTLQPSETVAGDPINGPPTVKLTNLSGNPVQGVDITASLNKNSFNGGSTTTVTTNSNGEAIFNNLMVDVFDTGYEITFSSEASGVADVTSNPFEVTDATLSMSVTTQPQQTVAGDTVEGYPAVTVSNGGGGVENVVVTASVNKNNFDGTSTLTATTDASGVAIFDNLILNTADTDYKISFNADYSGVPNAQSSPFEIIPASPDDIIVSTEPSETGAGSIIQGPPTALLLDEFGNPVSGVNIDVVPNQHNFASGTTTKTTNSNGKAIFDDLVLNIAEDNYQLLFTESGGATANSAFFPVTSAQADTLKILNQPLETIAGAAIDGPPTVLVEDEYGNPVADVTVSVNEESGYPIDAGTLNLETPDNGQVTFTDLVIDTENIGYQLRFSTGGIQKLSNKFNVVPGTIFPRFHGKTHSGFITNRNNNNSLGQTPVRIEIDVQPQESVVGSNIEGPPEIVVYDATDQPVPNISVTVSGAAFSSGTATLTTDENGHITYNDLVIDTKGTYNLTFTADNYPSINTQSNDFEVIDAIATMTMDVQPQETVAGQPVAGHPAVLLENSIGMPMEGVDIRVYINQHSFVSGNTTVQTDANGLAVFDDLVINKAAENYQLIFDANYSGVQNLTSGSFKVINASANNLEITTQPMETFQGATIEGPPAARVTDQFGNPVSGADVSVSEVSGAIDAGITNITSDVNGYATFSTLVINDNGTYQLNFSSPGLTDALSNNFQVVPGTVANRFKGSSHSGFGNESIQNKLLGQTPVRMEMVTQPLETVAGFAIEGPPVIGVYDALDNPVPNIQVTVSAIGGSLDNGTYTKTTNEQGEITFNDLIINTSGTYQLSFTADNYSGTVSDIQSSNFEVVDQVYDMQIETQPENTTAGQPVNGAPKVSITNFINQPLQGVDVTVYINQFGFSSGTMTVQTDLNGEAIFDDLVINTASEDYQLIFDANYSGVSNVTSDNFDITHAAPSTMTITTQPGETTEGAAIEGPPSVTLTDDFNNPVANEDISVSETGGYIFDGGTTTLSTDDNGLVSFSDLIINTIGTYGLTFSHPSLSDVTSDNFEVKSGTVSNRFKGNTHSGFETRETNNKLLGQTPARIEIVGQPQETVVGEELEGPPQIVVYDALDNTVANVDVSVTVPGGFKPGSTTTISTDENGEIIFNNLIIESVGSYQLSFSADNYPGVTAQSETFEVIDQQLYLSVTTQPGETTAGQPVAGHPTVQLANSIGQGYQGVDVTVYLNQFGFSSAPSTQTVTTNSSGYAEFDQIIINQAAENYQLLFEADYSGVLNVTSDTFNVIHAAADHLTTVTEPGETVAGATISGPPSVRAVDAFNNPVDNVTVSVAETGGYTFNSGTLSANTNENGIAAFNDLVIDDIGQYSLTYSAPGTPDLVSGDFNVISGTISYRFKGSTHSGFSQVTGNDKYLGQTPARIEIQAQPMETIVSSTIEGPPSIIVYDNVDNPVSGITIRVSVDGFFTPASTTEIQTNANGEVVFDNLVIDQTGTYTLTFEAIGYGDVDPVNSQEFEVVNQMLNASIVTQPSETVAGDPIAGPPEVKLENDFGQGFQGVDIIAHINQSNYTSSSTDTVTTDANGLATFGNLILENAAENYQVIFEIDYTGVNNLSSDFFDVIPAPASQFVMITQPEDGLAGAPVGGPPAVTLQDAYSNAIAGENVTVSEVGGYSFDGGTLNVTTNENGMAIFNDLLINTDGTYTLNFSTPLAGVSDLQSNSFTLQPSNIANRFKGNTHSGFYTQNKENVLLQQVPERIVILTQPMQSVVSVPIQGPPSLRVYDQTDIPVSGVAVTASVVGGSPSLSGTQTLTTDVNGEVLFDDISINQTGTYQLHFEVAGYPDVEVNSQNFEVINQTLSMEVSEQPQNTEAGQIIGGHPAVSITNEVGQPAPAGIDVVAYTNQNSFSSDPSYDTVQTNSSGIAVFENLVINEASDDYQIVFDAVYPGVANVSSNVFTIFPAPADYLQIITQPGDGEAGSVIAGPPAVGIYDVFGNSIQGIDVGVSEIGGEPLNGTTTIATDDNGLSVFSDLIIDNPGTYQLLFDANAAGVSDIQSGNFNIISTGTIHRFKGGSHSGFIKTEINDQLLSEPPEVEVPVFTIFEDTLCQGTLNTQYTAEAANNDSIRYEITVPSAGSIDNITGVLDLQTNFYGEFYVKATAYGYNGPKADSIRVIVEPEIDAPVFTDPVLDVCQGDITTYTATSVHTDSISYSVTPSFAGTMDANTGEINWSSGFSGSAQITATAGVVGDCGGQKQTTIDVTVNPEVETPVFTEGSTSLCQDSPNENYTATAAHSTDITYSRSPAEAGTIDPNTGEMDWASDFSGTVTITARAEGQCNGPKDKDLTVTIHPKPATSVISGEADIACNATGEVYSVDLNTGASYNWSVPTGASITSGASGPENNSITVDFSDNNGYIRVTETSQFGCVGDEQELQVTLYGCNLSSDFEASETETCIGNTVTFTDLSTGNVDTWEWDFGTAATPQTATGEGPHNVTYSAEGTYTVSLTVKEQTVEDTKTVTDYITVNKKGTWLGTLSSDWFDPDNWSCGEVPDNSGPAFDVVIPGGTPFEPNISAAGARVKDIEIENGANLSITNGVILNVYGNWINNGSFSTTNSTVTFRGDNSQITGDSISTYNNLQVITGKELTPVNDSIRISGDMIVNGTFNHNNESVLIIGNTAQEMSGSSDSLIFHNLIINKPNEALTLQRHVDISNYLTMQEGIINSSDSHLIRIMDDADSDEGNNSSFVDGPVYKTGNNPYTFPTGDNGVWAPIAITNPDLDSDVFQAEYFYSGHPEAGTDPCTNCGNGIKYVKNTEYWDLSRINGSSAPDVTMYFKDMARSGIVSIDNLVYGHWNGAEWQDKTIEGSAALDGSGGCYITGTGFSTYNIHAPAEPEADCPNTGNIFYIPFDFDL
jgi:5-hydroxyisourate hydrolase-like protein (transthyretin family)